MVTISRCLSRRRSSAWSNGQNGLAIRCSAASAAERVLVMTKSVAANPSRTRTRILPGQPRHQPGQHADRALAVERLAGHVAVDRQGAEQGDQHEHDRGERARAGRRSRTRSTAGSRGWRSNRRRSGT